MKILTKEELLGALDLEPVEFPVREWGGAIQIKGVSLGGREKMLAAMRDENGDISTEMASLVAFTYGVVEPKFDVHDFDQLREKNAGVVDRVVLEIMKLSGFSLSLMAQVKRGF